MRTELTVAFYTVLRDSEDLDEIECRPVIDLCICQENKQW